jgi:hypothetical protein
MYSNHTTVLLIRILNNPNLLAFIKWKLLWKIADQTFEREIKYIFYSRFRVKILVLGSESEKIVNPNQRENLSDPQYWYKKYTDIPYSGILILTISRWKADQRSTGLLLEQQSTTTCTYSGRFVSKQRCYLLFRRRMVSSSTVFVERTWHI